MFAVPIGGTGQSYTGNRGPENVGSAWVTARPHTRVIFIKIIATPGSHTNSSLFRTRCLSFLGTGLLRHSGSVQLIKL